MPQYVPYSDDVETIEPDEAETFQKISDLMLKGQHNVREKSGHSVRVSHAKAHGFLKGELIIANNLSPELAQGLFAQPGSHPVLARLAQAPGEILDDRKVSTPRGLAIKVFNVNGTMLPGHAAATQDLLLSTGKAFIAPAAKQFLLAFTPNATIAPKLPEAVKGATSTASHAANAVLNMFGLNSGKLDFYGHPKLHPLGESYYSQSAFRYGNYIAKISVTPSSAALQALVGKTLNLENENGVREAVVEYFRSNGAEFSVGVQLATDLKKMPVEDASVEWPEDLSPYRTVARLVFPAQNAFDPARQDFVDHNMSFSVTHSLAAHRPLGSLNRARLAVYPVLSNARRQENNKQAVEPNAVEQIPA